MNQTLLPFKVTVRKNDQKMGDFEAICSLM